MRNDKSNEINIECAQKKLLSEDPELAGKFSRLCETLKDYESGVVAFSGGVDSSLLAYLAHNLLKNSICVTANSPTLPRSELSEAKNFAKMYNLNHRIISYNELDNRNFVRNDENRCFFCKDGLFQVLNEIKEEEGYNWIMDGSNFDDIDDYRPGLRACSENDVKSPLIEAKMGKQDIRVTSKVLALPTWDKPQMACLSSRFPRNNPITDEGLTKVEKAESVLKEMGYRDVRVRIHGEIARIEIGKDEKNDLQKLKDLVPKIKELGFKYVALDLEGYRTGSLNE
jgi:uncharacterized protein